MGINSLIKKHGTIIQINGTDTKAHIDKVQVRRFTPKTSKIFDFLTVRQILTIGKINESDIIEISGATHLWLETDEEVYHQGKVIYYSNLVFEDVFINDVELHKQQPSQTGCNLPVLNLPHKTVKAYIRTIKADAYLQYSFNGTKPITHQIVTFYTDGMAATDIIRWNNRSFEVLAIENIDEKNKFLVFSCIEVIDA